MPTLQNRSSSRTGLGAAIFCAFLLLSSASPLAAQMGSGGNIGNVKQTLNVSGQSEAMAPLRVSMDSIRVVLPAPPWPTRARVRSLSVSLDIVLFPMD